MLALVLAAAVESAVLDAESIMARVASQATEDARLRYEHRLTGKKYQTTQDNDNPPREERCNLEMAPDGILQRSTFKDGKEIVKAPATRPKVDILTAMRTRYRLHLASPVPVDGYYVIAFSPADPDRPTADDEEVVMNHLSGVAYIDKDRFFIRRIHGWLEKGFSRYGVGRVQEASVLLNQELVHGLPVPQDSDFTVRFSKGLGILLNVKRRITIRYEYDPLPVVPAPSSQ